MDLHGVKMAVMHFVTQFTHVLGVLEFRVENKKNSLEKTVLIICSQICEKMAYRCVHKTTFRKSAKTKKNKNNKNNETFTIHGIFWRQN